VTWQWQACLGLPWVRVCGEGHAVSLKPKELQLF
jgi:hypothetical protein